jgi:pyruvate/2-oxoglutarate dehydrogenase complex dihydrolipoamide acyltransferase (E2) component
VIETPAPAQTMAAAASAPHSTKAAPSAPTAPAPAPAPAAAARAAAPAPAAPDPNDIQAKAQRFARLLIDEIKLYNLAKVEEGRKHRDLYDRLKDDIEKSRTTYERRYSNTPAASGDYFYHELVRSLAQDDPSLLGKNYRR